jgi:4,5-DOPA dioxygenase extradiol
MTALTQLKQYADGQRTERMPILFIGHGSPMNAILDNAYSQSWNQLGKQLPKPKAILSISAHWITRGTQVTDSPHPETIHDFGGFPQALFDAQYPAPGTPMLANETTKLVHSTTVAPSNEWGLDHGTWSVLKPMYPLADIPVYQLSIDYWQSPEYHYKIGQELQKLREKGVLIMGSGNVVHNLRKLQWNSNTPYDWALEFDNWLKNALVNGDHQSILNFQQLGALAKEAHPTYDHFLPLLYILGLLQPNEKPTFFNETFDAASISMRSVVWG